MQQFCVQKQGRYEHSNWSERILCIDPVNQVAYLSKKNEPSVLAYHKMRMYRLTLWPKYKSEFIDESMLSREAMLTVRLAGVREDLTRDDLKIVRLPLGEPPERVRAPRHSPAEFKERVEGWMLRCSDLEALQALLNVFNRINASHLRSGNLAQGSPVSSSATPANSAGDAHAHGTDAAEDDDASVDISELQRSPAQDSAKSKGTIKDDLEQAQKELPIIVIIGSVSKIKTISAKINNPIK